MGLYNIDRVLRSEGLDQLLPALPALARRDPQPQDSYVAPSPQSNSGSKSPGNTLNYCFV